MIEAGIPFESVLEMTYPQIEMLQKDGKPKKVSAAQYLLEQRAKAQREQDNDSI